MKPTRYVILIIRTFLFLLVFTPDLNAQDTLEPIHFDPIKIKWRYTRDAEKLAQALTENLVGEKEKFDALFTWVVWHMHYDNRLYRSGKPFRSKPIKRILRGRKGICLDYAHLMDTLCFYSGIENVTITGYSKEVSFDLYDTLYFDNHAWNAVKLDKNWYLYDATWCSGTSGWEYTHLASWRKERIRYLLTKTKNKILVLGSREKKRRNEQCMPSATADTSIQIQVLKFFPRIGIRLLTLFPFHTKETYRAVANTNYYLTNPDFFAISHFPNNPSWSLSTRIHNIYEFSQDSAAYDPDLYNAVDRKRKGVFCLDCDRYSASDLVTREQITYTESLKQNPVNRLIPANFNLFMSEQLFQQAFNENDSLTKMKWIDSTLNYLDTGKVEYRKSQWYNGVELRFQRAKNKAKRLTLNLGNNQKLTEAKSLYKAVFKRRKLLRIIQGRSKGIDHRDLRLLKEFDDSFKSKGAKRKLNDETRLKLETDLYSELEQADSLTQSIHQLQDRFERQLIALWANLYQEQKVVNPINNSFYLDAELRYPTLLDSYEYIIRELRTTIDRQSDTLKQTINTKILFLSDSIYQAFNTISQLVKARNSSYKKSVKHLLILKNNQFISGDSVQLFRQNTHQLLEDDICRNYTNALFLKNVTNSFDGFAKKLAFHIKVIQYSSYAEKKRYLVLDRHLKRNYRRHAATIRANSQKSSDIRRAARAHRKAFLQKK